MGDTTTMHGWLMASALFGGSAGAWASETDDTDEALSRVRVTARGGYTNYSRLHFVTGEAEVAVRAIAGLHGVAGVAVYGVNLLPPPQRQQSTGRLREWAALAPFHVGARYQLAITDWLQPFAGVDLLTGRYYQGEDGGAWAVGGRLRIGLDAMLTEHVGVHGNLGIGVWTGDRWSDLLVGMPDAGPLPQASLGVTWAL